MGSSKRSGVLEVMPKVSGATKALADVIEKDIPVGPACKHVPVAPSSLEGSLWVFYTCIMVSYFVRAFPPHRFVYIYIYLSIFMYRYARTHTYIIIYIYIYISLRVYLRL